MARPEDVMAPLLALWLSATALATTFYADADGDGYGDPATTVDATSAPSGYVADGSDCNDADATINPGESDVCDGVDEDCSGYADDAGDCPCDVEYYGTHTYWFCTTAAAWTDAEAACEAYGYGLAGVNSSAENSWVDSTADTYSTDKWWFGFNDRASEGTWVWEDGSTVSYTNWHSGEPNDSGGNEDCGQFNRWTDETWNDEPCTSSFRYICEYASPTNWYADVDGDGFGDPGTAFWSSDAPAGYIEDGTDCDDGQPGVYPGATETCDGLDDDCDGSVDEGLPTSTWYADADGDGFGDPATAVTTCATPTGYVADGTDCDDGNAAINPKATEICDGADDDCDGSVDEGLPTSTWYADTDADGFGDAATAVTTCAAVTGYVADDTDCDDKDAAVHPGATDAPGNAVDEDCDGLLACYVDGDGDAHGAAMVTETTTSCVGGGVAEVDDDCDDAAADVYPGAIESCNGRDDDCDGVIDEGVCDTGDTGDTGVGDTGTDTGTDTGADTGADTGGDTGADTAVDTGTRTDTGTGTGDTDTDGIDTDTGDTGVTPPKTGHARGGAGCACDSQGGGAGWIVVVVAAVAIGRRRSGARSSR